MNVRTSLIVGNPRAAVLELGADMVATDNQQHEGYVDSGTKRSRRSLVGVQARRRAHVYNRRRGASCEGSGPEVAHQPSSRAISHRPWWTMHRAVARQVEPVACWSTRRPRSAPMASRGTALHCVLCWWPAAGCEHQFAAWPNRGLEREASLGPVDYRLIPRPAGRVAYAAVSTSSLRRSCRCPSSRLRTKEALESGAPRLPDSVGGPSGISPSFPRFLGLLSSDLLHPISSPTPAHTNMDTASVNGNAAYASPDGHAKHSHRSPVDDNDGWSGEGSSGDEQTQPNGATKRKRPLSVSCEICKQRKVSCCIVRILASRLVLTWPQVKCDRGQPSCGWCVKNHSDCIYLPRKKPGLRAGYGRELEARLGK